MTPIPSTDPLDTAPATGPVVVLASASPARLKVLQAAGIDPEVIVSGVDEDALQAAHADAEPATLVAELAQAKAFAVVPQVADRFDDAVVIGCDSMLLSRGKLVGKPADADAVREQWAAMADTTSDLLTGHAVLRVTGGEVVDSARDTESTAIRFGTPDPEELEAYLATGEPLNVAGSLTIDGYGGWFVDGLDGDHNSVIGICLPLTRRLLRDIGISVIDLWRRTGENQRNHEERV